MKNITYFYSMLIVGCIYQNNVQAFQGQWSVSMNNTPYSKSQSLSKSKSALSLSSRLTNAIVNGNCREAIEILNDPKFNSSDLNDAVHGRPPLVLAAEYGLIWLIDPLINNGADVNFASSNGITPLMAAVKSGAHVVNTLIETSSSKRCRINFDAVNVSNDTAMMILLKATDPDLTRTPLDVEMTLRVLDILIENGANLNLDNGCETPLIRAAKIGSPSLIYKLVNAGASVKCVSSTGFTPLMCLAEMCVSNPELVEVAGYILSKGAKETINCIDKKHKRTALMFAVMSGNKDMVNLLLSHSARLDIRDTAGNTPLMEAEALSGSRWLSDDIKKKYADIADVLRRSATNSTTNGFMQ